MSVTPFLMMEVLADERRRDLKASAGARRRNRRGQIDVQSCSHVRGGLLNRFRHAHAA